MQAEVAMFPKKNWKENMDIIQMFPSGVSIHSTSGVSALALFLKRTISACVIYSIA